MPANKSAITRYRLIAELLQDADERYPVSIVEMRRCIARKGGQQVSISTIEKDIHALRHDKELGIMADIRAAPNGGFYLDHTIDIIHLNPFKTKTIMKLKTFNTTNTASVGRSSQPVISISHGGAFTINKSAAEQLGIAAGDRIELHQDEDSPKEWFISKCTTQSGFAIRQGYDAKGLMFNSSALRQLILKSCGKDASIAKGVRLPIGPTAIENKYWPLFTAALNKP
jgi:bifunctional DNA-binding transcriptional regulator/antitoxin component of YhaV-PrlF toxin-antitoxin module